MNTGHLFLQIIGNAFLRHLNLETTTVYLNRFCSSGKLLYIILNFKFLSSEMLVGLVSCLPRNSAVMTP